MAIAWRPYVRHAPNEAGEHELDAVERQWGVRLPTEYRQLVTHHQGMSPAPARFDIGRGHNSVCAMLTITRDERWDEYSVLGVYESLKRYVPPGVYPFATTPGDESLCFDYRGDCDEPTIVLVTGEGSIHPIASTFSGFLAGLHD
jgi:hypothetical protein